MHTHAIFFSLPMQLQNILVFKAYDPTTDKFFKFAVLADSGLARKGTWVQVRTPGTGTPGVLGFRSSMGCDLGISDQDELALASSWLGVSILAGYKALSDEFCVNDAVVEAVLKAAREADLPVSREEVEAACKHALDQTKKVAEAGDSPIWLLDYPELYIKLPEGSSKRLRVTCFLVGFRGMALGIRLEHDAELVLGSVNNLLDLRLQATMHARAERQAGIGQEAARRDPGIRPLASRAEELAGWVLQAVLADTTSVTLATLRKRAEDTSISSIHSEVSRHILGNKERLLGAGGLITSRFQCLVDHLGHHNADRPFSLCSELLVKLWNQVVSELRVIKAQRVRPAPNRPAPVDCLSAVVVYKQCMQLLEGPQSNTIGRFIATNLPLLLTPFPGALPKFGGLAKGLVAAMKAEGAENANICEAVLQQKVDPQVCVNGGFMD